MIKNSDAKTIFLNIALMEYEKLVSEMSDTEDSVAPFSKDEIAEIVESFWVDKDSPNQSAFKTHVSSIILEKLNKHDN